GNVVIDSGNSIVRIADLTTNGVVFTSGGNGKLNSEAQLAVSRGGTGQDFSGTAQGNIPYFSATGVISALAPTTANFVLTTQGVAANPQWTDVTTIPGVNFWNNVGNALSPKFASVQDLLLGSNATSSAKFAFINVNAGTPTASIAANTANNALTLDGLGNIGTTNRETLSLGTASTGDINFVVGGSNNLRINGVAGANVSANCVNTTNGIVTSSATCPSAAANFIWQTGSGAIFEGNITQDLLIGGQSSASALFRVTGSAAFAGTTSVASVS